jgi:serine/threonine-protein kinase
MIGSVFSARYELVGALGRGSMGRVFLARQRDRDRMVVVKLMHESIAGQPKFRQLFQREMESMARFHHPYAASLLDACLDDPLGPGLVMEYVPGQPLDRILHRERRLPVERVSRFLGQLGHALQAAHELGLIHRDLKPSNLMVADPDSPEEAIRVMDFGLASLTARPHIPLERLAGEEERINIAGTPAYICPEQLRGDETDHRGDLYSVGVILFELLTGRLPFFRENPQAVFALHVREAPPRFAEVGAAEVVPPGVEAIVLRCLAKFPNERPQTARTLAESFARAAGLPPEPPPAAEPVRATVMEAAAKVEALANTPVTPEPGRLVRRMDAWMPERVAVIKLRGFAHDLGGTIVGSEPGLVRVRLDMPEEPVVEERGGFVGLLKKVALQTGLQQPPPRRDPIELELHLEKQDPTRNRLRLTAVFRPVAGFGVRHSRRWQARCEQIALDLRSYLMA